MSGRGRANTRQDSGQPARGFLGRRLHLLAKGLCALLFACASAAVPAVSDPPADASARKASSLHAPANGHEHAAKRTAQATRAAAASASIRVLIDTSGSMKKNDPFNLRIAALRLLTGLVAPDAEAGAWLFGARTEVLVKPAQATEAWKERARMLATRIHSREAWTDIEQALAKVTEDWRAGPVVPGRAVILLTDGVVDVSADPDASAASRRRILGPLADELASAGIEVHSVALSDAADHMLLETLARRTHGRALTVADADGLDRAFLRLLESSAPREGLPMEGDVLLVDEAVSEITVLVFRAPGSAPLSLTSPEGRRLQPPGLPANVRWAREPAWDMVTIRQPQAGEWRVQGSIDPDNRALVVSSLSLEVPTLPSQTEPGSSIAVQARLLEDGQPIEREEFLELMTVRASAAPVGRKVEGARLARAAGQASYRGELSAPAAPGEFEVLVEVDGRTFRRQRRLPLTVSAPPLTAEFAGLAAGAEAFRLILEPPFSPAREGQVELRVETPDGQQETLSASLVDGRAEVAIPRTLPGQYTIRMHAQGLDNAGLPFEQRLGPWQLESRAPLPGLAATAPETPEPAAAVPAFDPNAPVVTDWSRVAWQVALANLLAGLATWLLRRHLNNRARRASAAWLMRVADAMA
jgi:uncharacterized protein (TIGR03503 family)